MRDQKQCAWEGCSRMTAGKYCDPHAVLSHAAAQKRYVIRNHKKQLQASRAWRKRNGNNRVPLTTQIPERGKILTVRGWGISETTYAILLTTYGQHWAESHCAALAARGRAA